MVTYGEHGDPILILIALAIGLLVGFTLGWIWSWEEHKPGE